MKPHPTVYLSIGVLALLALIARTDLHARGTQGLVAYLISFKHFLNDRALRLIAVLHRLDRLMHIGIEGLPKRRHRGQPYATQHLIQLPEQHTQGMLQGLLVHRLLIDQRPLDVIHDLENFMNERLLFARDAIEREALLALAEVLHLGALAQVFVPVLTCLLLSLG